MKTVTYKVTPVRFGVKAPYIMAEVQEGKSQENDAIEYAKQRSGLSRFESWNFIAEMV